MKNPVKFSKGLKKYNAGIGLFDVLLAIMIAAVLTIIILTVAEKVCVNELKKAIHSEDNMKRQW